MRAVIVETLRLRLCEMTPADLDFVAAMMGHPEVNHYYERTFPREECERWLDRQLERYVRDGHGLWLAFERESGEPLGQIGLTMQEVDGERLPEIGWLLHRPYWSRGYATEAGRAVADAAFRHWRYPRVISLIRPVNMPSRRVAERIGMTVSHATHFHGFDHLVYHLRPEAHS